MSVTLTPENVSQALLKYAEKSITAGVQIELLKSIIDSPAVQEFFESVVRVGATNSLDLPPDRVPDYLVMGSLTVGFAAGLIVARDIANSTVEETVQ